MIDELHNISAFERMEELIDYTAEQRKPDPRIVEPFGAMLVDHIVISSGYELELD
jgi:hypothetical protein